MDAVAGQTIPAALRVPAGLVGALRVPRAPEATLALTGNALVAADGTSFPIVNGVPVLIDEARSIFDIADYLAARPTTMDLRPPSWPRRTRDWVKYRLLGLSVEVSGFGPSAALAAIAAERPGGQVLVIGAGEAGHHRVDGLTIVFSDVAIGPLTDIILDAHQIPFADGTFDAVVAVAVLEHVLDPMRCVAEVERVLKADGLVYAVTPFMQQVHMGAYDFTRFSALGHRRLFRGFDTVREGIANGPGSALSWALEYWLTSFSDRPSLRRVLGVIGRVLGIPVRLTDRFVSERTGAWDGAGGFYFFGRKRERPIGDRELVRLYKGMGWPRA